VKNYNKIARQAGMTLIELTVVLLVLIGLAGLMIPYVSGFVGKTHDATGSDNIAEVSAALQRFDVENQRYPDAMDSMVDTAGALIGYTIADVMGVMGGGPAAYGMTVADISAAGNVASVCGSLHKAGINSVKVMDTAATVTDATFNNAQTATAGIVTTGTNFGTCAGDVVEIAGANVADAFDVDLLDADGVARRFVAFGIGQESELVGKVMTSAPVHFAQNGTAGANAAYNRFIAVFEVENNTDRDGNGTPDEMTDYMASRRAKFIGAGMAMMELEGMKGALARHYQTVNDEL